MHTHKHNIIKKNGYIVCNKCGETFDRDIRDTLKYNFDEARNSSSKKEFNQSKELRRAQRNITKNSNLGKINVGFYFLRLKTLIDNLEINEIQKKKIREKIMKLLERGGITNLKQMYIRLFQLIVKFNYPITAVEYITQIKEISEYLPRETRFKIFAEDNRKHFWYISKFLSKFDLDEEEFMFAYRIIYNYYRLVLSKINYSFDRLIMIRQLVYYTLKQYINQYEKIEKYEETFEILSSSRTTYRQQIFKKIKNQNWDCKIPNKLKFKYPKMHKKRGG